MGICWRTFSVGSQRRAGGATQRWVAITSATETVGVPYWDVVDLIEFPAEPEPLWIRIGYYRKPKDHLV